MLQNSSGRFLEQLAKQLNAASHCSPPERGPAGTERALDNCAPQEAAGLPEEQMFSILMCVSSQEPGPKSLQQRLFLTARGICMIKTLTSESWVEKTSLLLPAPQLSKQTNFKKHATANQP